MYVYVVFICSDTDLLLQDPKIRVNARKAVRPQDLYGKKFLQTELKAELLHKTLF